MSLLKEYADGEIKKGMVAYLLKNMFPHVPEDQYEDLTEVILNKFAFMNSLRAFIAEKEAEQIKQTAEDNDVTEDAVLDSFVYFYLVAETSWLSYAIIKASQEDNDEKE